MSTVENGVIQQLSVTQVESFDHKQYGGCQRRWWFERAMDLRPDQNEQQSDGSKGHELLAHYFRIGERPQGRPKMGKAVTGCIVKGELPAPGPDLLVEERFSGQPMRDAVGNWVPLDTSETLWLGGIPWDGAIDLAYRRGKVPVIVDHKFSSDPVQYAKPAEGLIKTVQMPVYVASQMPYWPDATHFEIAHHNVSKKGVLSFFRRAVVSVAQVRERIADVEATVEQMKLIAPLEKQNDIPFNRRSCSAWTGCPHQSVCSAFKQGAPTVTFSPDENELFDSLSLDEPEAPDAPAAPPEEDPFESITAPAPAPAPAAFEAVPKPRRIQIVDVPAPEAKPAAVPPPASAQVAVAPAPCACGATLTAENGSRLQSGQWKHIGCPLEVKAPVPPVPKARKAKATTATVAPAPAAQNEDIFAGVTAPPVAVIGLTNPMPAPHVVTPRPTPPVAVKPLAIAQSPTLAALADLSTKRTDTREALAALLENLATLVRSAA